MKKFLNIIPFAAVIIFVVTIYNVTTQNAYQKIVEMPTIHGVIKIAGSSAGAVATITPAPYDLVYGGSAATKTTPTQEEKDYFLKH